MNTKKAVSTGRSPRRSNEHRRREDRKERAPRTSRRSAAGWALSLLLLSPSSCTAFRGPRPPSPAIRRRRRGGGEPRYCDGDDYDYDERPADARLAVADDAGGGGGAVARPPGPRGGDGAGPAPGAAPARGRAGLAAPLPPRSSPSPPARPAAVADARQQADVYEYIEYLERPYGRIRREATAVSDGGRPFAVLDHPIARSAFPSWTLAPSASASFAPGGVAPRGGECDRLSVLGLSGLASDGLRRRLNGASPPSRTTRGLLGLLLDRARPTATALASWFQIMADFFIMTVVSDLLGDGMLGLPVTSCAVLLLARPLLRRRHLGQGLFVINKIG
jgi:hypothetical protein